MKARKEVALENDADATSRCVDGVIRSVAEGLQVVQITSFPGSWSKLNHRGILSRSNRYPLIVYRDDLDSISHSNYRRAVSCEIRLFDVFPWLHFETRSHNSSLNRFLRFAGAYEPFSRPMHSKVNHLLFRKMLAVWHMLSLVTDGTLVIWLDSDVTIESELSDDAKVWLMEQDLAYIPTYHARNQANQRVTADWYKVLKSDWFVETGIISVTKSFRTELFFKRIIELYLGGLQEIAELCISESRNDTMARQSCACSSPAVYQNLFMNDIFVFTLLTQAALSKNRCVSKYDALEELAHGWLGISADCLDLTKKQKKLLRRYPHPNFCPLTLTEPKLHTKSFVSGKVNFAPFHISDYFFHRMGTTGAARLLIRNRTRHDHWLDIPKDLLNEEKSLFHKLRARYVEDAALK